VLLELTKPYEPDGPLCAQLRGVVDGEILRRALSDVASACARTGEVEIVLDLSAMESRCSLVDMHSIGDDLYRAGFRPAWRMAVVGTQFTTHAEMLQDLCQGRGIQVRFFKTVDEAADWLANSR
jgi:SpoIIAA-like